MPRPNKPINRGRLDDEVSPARAHTWTKHSSEPGASETLGDPSDIEVKVDDIIIIGGNRSTAPDSDVESKYHSRGTAAHLHYGEDIPQAAKVRYEEEWSMERWIDDRTYHRIDTMTRVEVPI